MPTSTNGQRRAELSLADERLLAPAAIANSARNARAEVRRHARWAPAREAAWELVEPLLVPGARVAIVGAGNGDTLPLERITDHAGEVALIDLDGPAIRTARRRQSRRRHWRIDVIEHDITCGAADVIAAAAANGEVSGGPTVPERPLPGAPYDLVIGDLFYSQLLYPALVDLDVPDTRTAAFLDGYGPMVTRAVVSWLHVSAREGQVLHIHDPIAWWPEHPQPVTLELILATAEHDPAAALSLAARGSGPRHTDPRPAIRALSIPITVALAVRSWRRLPRLRDSRRACPQAWQHARLTQRRRGRTSATGTRSRRPAPPAPPSRSARGHQVREPPPTGHLTSPRLSAGTRRTNP